ncbi:hypothetical protein Tco_0629665, partial [Tanacetum coccineum]
EEGKSVSSYVLKMKGYIDNLERRGHPMSLSLVVSLILVSLRKEYDSVVQNYNMNGMGKMKKNKNKKPQLAARGKNQGKGKSKLVYASKPKIPPPPKKEDPAKDSVYDTGCGTHICNTTQGFKRSRKLKPGALKDIHPSENTSLHHDEDNQEIDEPQSDIIPIRGSTRTRHAPDQMCLNIKVDEYELGDLNEPANYKAVLSDPEFDKWLKAMNVEMQSIKDNEV